MPQIFHPSANTLSRLTIFGALIAVIGLVFLAYLFMRSPYQTQVRVIKPQPVPFSHEHHVRGLGIDCRYCHTMVETSAVAGLPPTHTCMSCHSQIWASSPMLEPVRASFAEKKPLAWTRVHDLPDFVYFNHSIHVQKGVGCVSCHGRVDQMPMMWKEEPLTMGWCLGCHRNPEQYLRDKKDVFRMDLILSSDAQLQKGRELVKHYGIELDRITNCSVCHR
jgi:Cytochrome c7 and related cytochrome c